jgi:hypothetical protein
MASRIPKRLHGPALVTNTAATKYTVPTNVKTIVRHIHVSNPSGSTVTFTLSIGADAAAVRIFDAFPISANSVLDHFGIYALAAGEIIQAFAGTTNVLTLTIDGDEELAA